MRLAPLVFARPGELRHAKWEDIDFDTAQWSYIVTKTETPHIDGEMPANVMQERFSKIMQRISPSAHMQQRAISFVEENIKATNHYMNAHGLVHFDAHFRNILTDGETLFLSDFGLALSEKFDLTLAES